MTGIKSISDIGLVYEQMREAANAKTKENIEVVEEKAVKKLESFPKAIDKKVNLSKIMAKGTDKNAFVHKDSGPEAAKGVAGNVIDPETTKKNNFFEPEKFSDNCGKLKKESINNSMKSIFDKLYEDVMGGDKLDIGLQAGPEGEAADAKDLDLSTGEDTVTIKLDKELAQKLHDALVEVLGGEEDNGGEEDLGSETAPLEDKEEAEEKKDEAEEAEEKKEDDKKDKKEVAGEGTDIKEVSPSAGQSLVGHGTKNAGKVPTVGNVRPKGGNKASGDVGGVVDGKGKTLPPAGGHSLTKPGSWNVNATGYKVGDLFK